MLRLEDVRKGQRIKGIKGSEIVTVKGVDEQGENIIEVFYKDENGKPDARLVTRDEEYRLELISDGLPFDFSGDGRKLRLVTEAHRIRLAHAFDPYLAMHTSSVEPLPHQISAVYEHMLPRVPLRFLLADDPGAGKTIMTGLFIKEMMARGDFRRVLIVAPGSLVEQWQDELRQKFSLNFHILTQEDIQSADVNVFQEIDLMIARLDKLSRDEPLIAKLRATDWDFVVADEAHKMSASTFGRRAKYTKRYKLGRVLSGIASHFLLLTATPHSGKEDSFYHFLALLDPDRFAGASRAKSLDVSDVMRRIVKEKLVKFDGRKLFPPRTAYTVMYSLSPAERELYEAVTEYVRKQFRSLKDIEDGKRRSAIGFALTMLQRRLASSPEAIFRSLRRRLDAIDKLIKSETFEHQNAFWADDADESEFSSYELESTNEENVTASSADTLEQLSSERETLKGLVLMAEAVRRSGTNAKWSQLSGMLNGIGEGGAELSERSDGSRPKIIIFTEQRDTLNYLTQQLRRFFGRDDAVVNIHGAMPRDDRRDAEERFKQDKDAVVLIATDAAGEGINLQVAHLMINYDIPWNPNRLEQRFGRIHRIGQTEPCHMWNIVAADTREGDVFERLLAKIKSVSDALGSDVFNVLGDVFENRSLRDMIMDAIACNSSTEAREWADRIMDSVFDMDRIREVIKKHSITTDVMDEADVERVLIRKERMEARKMQPHFIQAFFLEAFKALGGSCRRIISEEGRFEIVHVPASMTERDKRRRSDGLSVVMSSGAPLQRKYARVCFDRSLTEMAGKQRADLLCPGHVLLNSVVDDIIDMYDDDVKHGAVMIDDTGGADEPYLLVCVESAIVDGTADRDGKPTVVSKRLLFLRVTERDITSSGLAPHLNIRAASDDERSIALPLLERQQWLNGDAISRAVRYASGVAAGENENGILHDVRSERLPMLKRQKDAVSSRLIEEINYWDKRSRELRLAEEGKAEAVRPDADMFEYDIFDAEPIDGESAMNDILNSKRAKDRADALSIRRRERLSEIELQEQISAVQPVVKTCFAVVPSCFLLPAGRRNDAADATPDAAARKAVELAAMNAVMDTERKLGYMPQDISRQNEGYDIMSEVPRDKRGDKMLRFIEVKGRAKGAETVTVTNNEHIAALNVGDQHILALVEVDGDKTHVTYLRRALTRSPEAASTCTVFSIKKLLAESEVIYSD